MTIYQDKISESLGLLPITFYFPDFKYDDEIPKDAKKEPWVGSITPTPKGGKLSEEHKKALRVPRPGAGLHGNQVSGEKHFAKIVVVCPHCKKQGGGGTMRRWHFDNCRKKINE